MKKNTLGKLTVSTITGLALAFGLLGSIPSTSRADQVAGVEYEDDAPTIHGARVQLTTQTPGATIFYKANKFSYPSNPTHSGSSPTNGSGTYNPASGGLYVPWGERLYIKAIAYLPGSTDSVVTSYVCDNTGN